MVSSGQHDEAPGRLPGAGECRGGAGWGSLEGVDGCRWSWSGAAPDGLVSFRPVPEWSARAGPGPVTGRMRPGPAKPEMAHPSALPAQSGEDGAVSWPVHRAASVAPCMRGAGLGGTELPPAVGARSIQPRRRSPPRIRSGRRWRAVVGGVASAAAFSRDGRGTGADLVSTQGHNEMGRAEECPWGVRSSEGHPCAVTERLNTITQCWGVASDSALPAGCGAVSLPSGAVRRGLAPRSSGEGRCPCEIRGLQLPGRTWLSRGIRGVGPLGVIGRVDGRVRRRSATRGSTQTPWSA